MSDNNHTADAEPTDDDSKGYLPIERRTALKAIPAAIGLAGLGAFTGLASAWEADADNRIQQYRTTDIDVTVLDSSGNAVSNADVDVAMVEHEFGFGSAANAQYFIDQTSPGGNYRRFLRDLFNKSQLENRNKWAPWENEWEDDDQQEAIDTINWLIDRGLNIHGHTNIWQHTDFSLPQRIVDELNKDNPDDQYLQDETRQRQRDFTSYWADTVGFTEFCVQNEPSHETAVTDEINEEDPQYQPTESLRWFEEAASEAGHADLYTNDYNVINQDGNDNYKTFINHLVDNDAPLDAIGMQGHHWGSRPEQDASTLLSILDEFHAIDEHPIQILEYDTADMNNDNHAGDYLYKFMKVIYSHPATVGFQMWGFYSGRHWQDQAPLFETDWTKKPGYYNYIDLLFNQWWTNTSGSTDGSGSYSTNAFLGTYQITARGNGERGAKYVTVRDPTHTRSITVQMDTSGVSATDVIQAEHIDDGSGVDASGSVLTSADDGDWAKYAGIDFGDGVDRFEAILSSGSPGNDVEVRLDGPSGTLLGTLTVEDTGGYDTFSRQAIAVSSASNVHDVYLRFVGGSGVADIERFRFVRNGRPSDATAPSTPQNLTSPNHSDDSVDLDWDPSTDNATGIDQYHVYQDGTKVKEVIDPMKTETTVRGLSPSTTYDFEVTAVDGADNESGMSNTVSVTTAAEGTGAPIIDQFDVQNNSNPNQAKFGVDWAVSDNEGDLNQVTTQIRHDGRIHDSSTTDVSGSSASGSDDLLSDDSHHTTYKIDLIVQDEELNETTETKEMQSQ